MLRAIPGLLVASVKTVSDNFGIPFTSIQGQDICISQI